MISRIHAKLGTVGLIVAIVALVAALAGTAFAAAGLNGKQKQEVKKIAKKVAKPGPQGPQGPAGLQGPKGDTGASGKNGADGVHGEDGACSVSVPKCVLPPGATESGQWGITATEAGPIVQISYSLRVESEPVAEFLGPDPTTWTTVQKERCPGTAVEPEAAPGFLCIYQARGTLEYRGMDLTVDHDAVAGTEGHVNGWLGEFFNSGGEGWAVGSWAVTAATA